MTLSSINRSSWKFWNLLLHDNLINWSHCGWSLFFLFSLWPLRGVVFTCYLVATKVFNSILFFKLSFRMTMVIYQHMKIVLLVSFLLLQGFPGCLEWYLEILALWMTMKIHFESCQILHISALISCAVETRMEAFALAYSEFFQ